MAGNANNTASLNDSTATGGNSRERKYSIELEVTALWRVRVPKERMGSSCERALRRDVVVDGLDTVNAILWRRLI